MMKLVGASERRYFDGRGSGHYVTFQKPDGSEFDMAVNIDQMALILQESGQMPVRAAAPPAPPPRQAAPQSERRPSLGKFPDGMLDEDDEDLEGVETIKLAELGDTGEPG